MKFLEDPKGAYGDVENINTLVRKGFKEEMPEAFQILERFYWEPEDMEAVMHDAQDSTFEEAANKWIEENANRVAEWTDGVEKGNGEKLNSSQHHGIQNVHQVKS